MPQNFRVTLSVQVDAGNDEDGQPKKVSEQALKKHLQDWLDQFYPGQQTNPIKVGDVEEYPT